MNNAQLQQAIDSTRRFVLEAQPLANSGPKYEAWKHAVETLKGLQYSQVERSKLKEKNK